MLHIKTRHTNREWHIGQPMPNVEADSIKSLQADGDELDYIVAKFSNIPFCNENVQIWISTMAQYIYTNLRLRFNKEFKQKS